MLNKLFLILILVCNSAISQPLNIEEFKIADGLSDGTIHYVLQDRYGLLWIATSTGGLNMYDGYTFKAFKNVPGNPNSILSNELHGLLEDAQGNIWIANSNGVSRYNRAENNFVNYDFEELFPDKIDAFGNLLNITMDGNQKLWVSSNGLGMLSFDSEQDTWILHKYKTKTGVLEADDKLVIASESDQQGRLWAGVFEHGLMMFDGEEQLFKQTQFKNNKNNPDFTKLGNEISCIFNDPTGILWITSRSGIYKLNPQTMEIKTLVKYQTQSLNFWAYFNQIIQDSQGNVWIANNIRGVLKFDGISDDFEEISFEGQFISKDGVSNIVVTSMLFDQSGIMWMGTIANGLIKHDPQRTAFKHFQHQPDNPNSLSSSQIFGLYESHIKPNQIYVGMRGGGLNILDPQKEQFKKIPLSFNNDVFGGSVRVISEDDDGTLWLGLWGDGLLHIDNKGNVINQFQFDSSKTTSLPDNLVRVLEKDTKNNYWIGTNSGGLIYLDTKNNSLKRYSDNTNKVYPQELFNLVKNKLQSESKPLMIKEATDNANLSFEFKITKPRKYLIISTGEGSSNDIELADWGWISDAQDQEIWSGKNGSETFHLGGAVKNRIKIDMQELKPGNYSLHFKSDLSHSFGKWNQAAPTYLDLWGIQIIELNDPEEINHFQSLIDEANEQIIIEGRNIRSIHVNKDGIVWVGTDTRGLGRLDPAKRTIKYYATEQDKENVLSDNSVQFIYENADGILWLATNGGLNRFDPETENFTIYTEEHGLPTNYIASILPAESGNLWLATRNGLSKMITSPTTKQVTFVNYGAEDGLGGTDFIAQVALKSSAGNYYFGGEHGLNIFSRTKENEAPPALYLSDLRVGNVSLLSQKSDMPLDTTLTDINEIELVHDKNDLTFTYSALHFSKPSKNQYAHFLKGYDEDWIYDNKRTATYTNLDPGDYVFSFKGSNRDGIWNETGKSISITIRPPWWHTIWAYIGYGLFFIGIVFGVDRIQRRRLIAKSKERLRIQAMEHRAETAELQAKAMQAEQRALQIENERKTKELEEARELQLSMLPKELPQLPNLDIAVYMQTATEVGGDYYDFHVGLDGTLTVVIGDATGHGMKAGTMVTTAKSLFNSYAPNPDILFSFSEITRCIKQMNFGKLSMCLTMLKIKGDKMQISTAGMPPSFIFRRDTRVVEEHVFQGMPLGTMMKFPYEVKDTTLKPGDTILLMSDGLPELANDKDEMYGYKKIRNGFEEVAEQSSEEIISYLKNEGKSWSDDQAPDDDVTFVVIKVK
ncbi:MAG: hypothetical protein D8M58_10325 [Calditrichaeota bacterium]|nr:MAG: hypothetical protein DWQ03_09700 [Calditrichota bacterium]MBL1205785.1 hypothetical protein [Calditrichota bacterium]NOG45613.1 SpoIIE family protein phosphatase [Calditrichota bacterium]